MRMKNAMQLKAHVNNMAKEAGIRHSVRAGGRFSVGSWLQKPLRGGG